MFTARELLLARTSSASLRLVLDRSATSLGQVFSRAHGQPVAGFVISKVGREGSRVVWKVAQVEPAGQAGARRRRP